MIPYLTEIRRLGESLISRYRNNNEVSCGINGPYDDQETRVRDLSHLIIIASLEQILFDDNAYRNVIAMMVDELKSFKDDDGVYRIRIKPGKDECNGVLGHAWVMEAFIYAYKSTKDRTCLDEAVRIAEKHGFHQALGLWCRPLRGIDVSAIDYTFNHQLWYAATLMELNQYVERADFQNELSIFFDRLDKNFKTNRQGRITHHIYNRQGLIALVKQFINKERIYLNEMLGRPSFRYKEEGYHLFNLMAFARIHHVDPTPRVFQTRAFGLALSYLDGPFFFAGLMNKAIELDGSLRNGITEASEKEINIYGYPYNVPGFEAMFVQEVFKTRKDVAEDCLSQQFHLTFDVASGLFGERCHDKTTINYRIYEYYRYLELVKK